MANCPVCGANVPAGTQYCPTCGTNLQTIGAQPAPTQPPTYSPGYSYPPQGGMGIPGQQKPHGHGKYIIAIIAALIIGLIIGAVIGLSFPVSADFTTLNGTATLSSRYTGTPNLIYFNSTVFGNLTSAVISNNYLVNLPIGDTYAVSIRYLNVTGTFRCIPTPNSFTSNNQNAAQDFSC